MSLADRIVVMDQGAIMQTGSPASVYDHPANLFVAQFVGSPGMNLIAGCIQQNGRPSFRPHRSDACIPCPAVTTAGDATLGIRPEFLRLDPQGPLSGKVAMSEYMGSVTFLHIDVSFGRLVVRADPNEMLRPGDSVRVNYSAPHARIFDAAGDAL